jgi:glycosyltransferase involved in cell wall biosynthesis
VSKTVALVCWGDLFEDFLDKLGVTLEEFRSSFTGSWIFGYVQALESAGVQSVLFCVSSRVQRPVRFTHGPSGVRVCILPSTAVHSRIVNWIGQLEQSPVRVSALRRTLHRLLEQLVPYLDTPLHLFYRELRRAGCDSILCQQYEYQRFDALVMLGRLTGIPVFATCQGNGDDWGSGDLQRLTRPLALHASAGLIAAARGEALRLRARYDLPPSKIARIFNPIDLTRWSRLDRTEARAGLGIPIDADVVVWHGRVEYQKGLDLLLYAWERLCQERAQRDLRLLMVGTGSQAESLRSQIASLQLRGVQWVDRFVNDRNELLRYLAAGDIYAFPSRGEGFPVAPLEAMACSLPIVAADAQGVSDILKGGEASGGIVVPCNDPPALTRALGRLLDDEPLRCELGRRARRRLENSFSVIAVGEQLRDFLSSGQADRKGLQPPDCLPELMPAPLELRAIWPSRVPKGTTFNLRYDGQSRLSIAAEHANRGTLVVLGNQRLVTHYESPSFLRALVPLSVLKRVGPTEIYLTDGERRSNALKFTVTEYDVHALAVPEGAVSPESFSATIDYFTCPSHLMAGQQCSIEMSVRNDSPVVWPVTDLGVPAVRLTYHWMRLTGEIYDYAGLQTELPHTLEPGETTRIAVWIQAPAKPGCYLLAWDLLIEQVAWFSARGWKGPVCQVSVQPSPTAGAGVQSPTVSR